MSEGKAGKWEGTPCSNLHQHITKLSGFFLKLKKCSLFFKASTWNRILFKQGHSYLG